jgi:deoxyxylulose-5-phosphate synthase
MLELLSAFIALTHAGVSKDLVVQLNDSDMSFDEIAEYLDPSNELANLK